jgi:nucleoid-associated protein YgaU
VRTPSMANPNNAVIVPTVGKTAEVDSGPDRHQPEYVIEYIVQPNDTWTGLAGKFFNDQTRFPEMLAFNHLPEGSALQIGQKLYIPLTETDDTFTSPEKLVVLGEGATQIVDATLVQELKTRWVNKQKLAETADEATVLAEFLAEKGLWGQDEVAAKAIDEVTVIQYVVQLGDSWAGIAGKMLGDQMRYPEIIAFNGLNPDVPLRVGQTIRIPPKTAVT